MLKKLLAISVSVLLLAGCTPKTETPSEGANSPEPTIEATADTGSETSEEPTEQLSTGSKELNIFTWANYIPDEVIADFETETGILVNYGNFDTNEDMLAKLEQQKGQYDIIVCSDYAIDIMREKGGMIQKLDTAKIENYKNINPAFQSQYFDPDNEYTVPYTSTSALIAYDNAKVDFEIKGYADFWKPEFKNNLVMLDGGRDIIGLTLQMLGYSINETDAAHLEEAKAKLLELKPNVAVFAVDTPQDALINGDAIAGYMYPSQAIAAKEAVDTIEFVYAEEGIGAWNDAVVLAEEAPNKENAELFINYILDGKVSAKISSIINYANLNTAAAEFLPEEYLNNKAFVIPEAVLEKSEAYRNIGDTSIVYDEIWTEFKSN